MSRPKLTDHQERYDIVEERTLYKEFSFFINNCKKANLSISTDLEDENGGFDVFRRRADECDYKIGMKPTFDKDKFGLVVRPFMIDFVSRETIYVPFQKNPKRDRSKGRNPGVHIDNIQDIPGFGIKLNLLGWSKFCAINVAQMKELVESGNPIECIYSPIRHNQGKGRIRVIRYNGIEMSTSEACEKALINRADFERRARGFSDEQRQELFDTIVKNNAPDYRLYCNRHWILVDEDDFCDIISVQKHTKETIPQIISRLIMMAKEIKNAKR